MFALIEFIMSGKKYQAWIKDFDISISDLLLIYQENIALALEMKWDTLCYPTLLTFSSIFNKKKTEVTVKYEFTSKLFFIKN